MERKKSMMKGALIGGIAGLGAAYLMGPIMKKGPKFLEEKIPASKKPLQLKGMEESFGGEEPSTVQLAERVSHLVVHKDLPDDQREAIGQAVHYVFGTILGALYGMASAGFKGRKHWYDGFLYGFGIWLLADEVMVPLLKLSRPPLRYPASIHLAGLGAHLVYGAAVDTAVKVGRH